MLLFIVELVPVFIAEPSNPSTVLEGQNLTLQWSYNLDGQTHAFTSIADVTGGSAKIVATRSGSSNGIIIGGYENQFEASISDAQAVLTILAVPRSVNGERYLLSIATLSNSLTSNVEISVLCEYKNYSLLKIGTQDSRGTQREYS